MKPAARAMAFAAALALHAVLIVAIVGYLSQRPPAPVRTEPVEITLLRPAVPARPGEKPRPASPPPPQKQTTEEPPPQPPKPETKRQTRTQHSKLKPEKHHPKTHVEKHTPPPQQQPTLPASPPPPVREPVPAAAPTAGNTHTAPATPVPGHHAPAHTGASIPASYAASNAEPPYPRLSRLNEEQGTVMLRVLVKPDGTVAEVRIQSSSGYPLLDRSASATVRGWRFNPATVDGKPVAEWCQVPVQFTLPGS